MSDPQYPIVEHAIAEMLAYGMTSQDVSAYAVVIQAFAEIGLPEEAQPVAAQLISDLLFWKNLIAISDDPAEWVLLPGSDSGGASGVYQNIRNPQAFSADGGTTYYLMPEMRSVLGAVISASIGTITRTSASKPIAPPPPQEGT